LQTTTFYVLFFETTANYIIQYLF